MPTLDLTDEEREALIRFLRDGIEHDPFPYAPRLRPLKAVCDKLQPKPPLPEPQRIVPPRLGRKPRR